MSDKDSESKTKADDVHVSDGLAKLHEVAEQLTEEEAPSACRRSETGC
ncbi:hypothetical protein O1V64_21190 [Rouxiella badensis]|nr:hypothetical protein O1V64_21190 [Rouxiella badensis]